MLINSIFHLYFVPMGTKSCIFRKKCYGPPDSDGALTR